MAEEISRSRRGDAVGDDSPRRRFAVSLYQTVAGSQSLGMSEERLMYHLRAALERYRRAG